MWTMGAQGPERLIKFGCGESRTVAYHGRGKADEEGEGSKATPHVNTAISKYKQSKESKPLRCTKERTIEGRVPPPTRCSRSQLLASTHRERERERQTD